MSDPMIYPDPPKPDAMAKGVRAVFGGLLGLVLAAGFCIRLGGPGLWATLLLATFTVAFCVCGAVKLGDSFWESLARRQWPSDGTWFD